MSYRVDNLIGDIWQVIDLGDEFENMVYQGSLSDCEAYIRLNERGYM